jgi:Skp family chaperone for outer membrane proteins
MCASAAAEVKRPGEEVRLGVADVEHILHSYWRTPRVRSDLERYKTSEEFRQKQMDLAKMERELARRRFAFFQDRQANSAIQEKRKEIREMAGKEAERAREREKEAIEDLLTDIRKSAESIGREKQHTVIFDSNTPHILFLNTYSTEIDDVTNEVIEELNSR